MDGRECAYNTMKSYVVEMTATPFTLHTESKLSLLSRLLKYILHNPVSIAM